MAGLNRQILQDLSSVRLADAKVLLDNQRFAAAFYLAGYSVECALKACIARQTQAFEFPDKERVTRSYTHRLEQLIGLTHIPMAKVGSKLVPEDCRTDKHLDANWSLTCNKWSEDSRYQSQPQSEAEALYNAVSDPVHGVIQWLQKYW